MNDAMNWLDMTPGELSEALREMGEPAFRAKQVFSWLHKGKGFDEMANLPKALREKMSQARPLGGVSILEKRVSRLDGTAKYLFLLEDGNIVEGVLMRYRYGNTLCISTQVGCRMGCTFCASTLGGLVRNLRPGEILSEVLMVNREQMELSGGEKDREVTNLVLMGSGEPLDNYDNVIKFLQLVNEPQGICISHRNISLSTCGLAEKIVDLAKTGMGVTLSISLHAPNDRMRRELMPVARKYSIAQLMVAAREYVRITGRRVVFEYTLVRGKNDGEAQARELAALLRGLQCHVNLIPLNEVKERGMEGTAAEGARAFQALLEKLGISATIRRRMGDDIEGACGQLRRSYLGQKNEAME